MSQKLKILYLIKIFFDCTDSGHFITMPEIISSLEKYGIKSERKSIYSDINALRSYGIDIKIHRGKTVGYYIADRFMDLSELKYIIGAVETSSFIPRRKSSEIINKISDFCNAGYAFGSDGHRYIRKIPCIPGENVYNNLGIIHDAMTENRAVSFSLFRLNPDKSKFMLNGGKEYLVSPWSITEKDNLYFLDSYDMQKDCMCGFRIDKMENIRCCTVKRTGYEAYRSAKRKLISEGIAGLTSEKYERVILRCGNECADAVFDRFGTDLKVKCGDDGFFDIMVMTEITARFLAWVISFSGAVTVLSPAGVAAEVSELAQKTLSACKAESAV